MINLASVVNLKNFKEYLNNVRHRVTKAQNHHKISLLIIFFFTLSIYMYRSFSTDIADDSAMHTYLIKIISRNWHLYNEYPNAVVDVTSNGQIIHMPVTYPQLFFVLFAPIYAVGGEIGIKICAAILGASITIITYLILCKLVKHEIALLGALILSLNTNFFSVSINPYMESFIGPLTGLCIYLTLTLLSKPAKKTAVWTGICLGLLVASKQEGLLFFGCIFVLFLFFGIQSLFNWSTKKICTNRSTTLLLAGAIILGACIAFPFYYYMLTTTGAIEPYPIVLGKFLTPLFPPKYSPDYSSIMYIDRFIEAAHSFTLPDYFNFLNPIPAASFPSLSIGWSLLSALWLLLCVLGALYLYKHRQNRAIVFFVVFFAVCGGFMVYMRFFNFRYFLILLYLSLCLTLSGINLIFDLIQGSRRPHSSTKLSRFKGMIKSPTMAFFIIFVVAIGAYAEVANVYREYLATIGGYKDSDYTTGGRWPDRIAKTKEAGAWIQEHTDQEDILLVGRVVEGTYYFDRPCFWIHELGGHNIPRIFAALNNSAIIFSALNNSEHELNITYNEALERLNEYKNEYLSYLREYRVAYIVIDNLQFSAGYVERIYAQRDTLFKYLDSASNFEKVYPLAPYENDFVAIYRVVYE